MFKRNCSNSILLTLKNSSSSNGNTSNAIPMRVYRRFLFCVMAISSSPVGHALAQQARGAQREHDDQHDEGEDVGVVAAQHAAGERADVARADGFDQAQEHASHDRAGIFDANACSVQRLRNARSNSAGSMLRCSAAMASSVS